MMKLLPIFLLGNHMLNRGLIGSFNYLALHPSYCFLTAETANTRGMSYLDTDNSHVHPGPHSVCAVMSPCHHSRYLHFHIYNWHGLHLDLKGLSISFFGVGAGNLFFTPKLSLTFLHYPEMNKVPDSPASCFLIPSFVVRDHSKFSQNLLRLFSVLSENKDLWCDLTL